jgi:hypothetical protein
MERMNRIYRMENTPDSKDKAWAFGDDWRMSNPFCSSCLE